MIAANAFLSSGYNNGDYGSSISQRLLKAREEYVLPEKKKYNPIKNLNERLWGYFEEFRDYVHIGDSVNLRSIVKECPRIATYFEHYDNNLFALMELYNKLIEHARFGECKEVLAILEDNTVFIDVVHSFVGNIDIKKQCLAMLHFAKKDQKDNLATYIRQRSEMISTMSARYEVIRSSSNRRERVVEFNDLLAKIKEGDNAGIRLLRTSDPNLASDIADIIECDRLVNFNTMLECASVGNSVYMKYLVEQYPYLVNYISDQQESIFFNAVKNQHLDVIKTLTNCDYDILDHRRRSALHISCGGIMKPIIYFLLHNGANVNAQDKNGDTPLHYVCNSARPSTTIIKMLISNEARIDIRNKHRMTCLDILARNGHDTLQNFVKTSHRKEQSKLPIKIKSTREKNRDKFCFKHLSYSCPCAVSKKHAAR